ncbi:MAG: glycosyltransferase family 2 protein [Leptolinea sp.]
MIKISIIIPCLNEDKTIGNVLQAIYLQQYPKEFLEVVLADGGSIDQTLLKIEGFKNQHPDLSITLINNPLRHIPAALNRAISTARGEIIIRMDAHSLPRPDYVQRCAQALLEGKGENVGGKWEILPGANTWIARGIAIAASHPLGVGDARYRISGQASSVDTVPFGCYYRSLFDRIGFFDETLLTNEDYEFNTRIRQNNGTVWFDPEIICQYFARPTLQELAIQYWRYGFWKAKMVKRYPTTIKLRQVLPPLFVASLIGLLGLGLFISPVLSLLLTVFLLYVGIISVASIPAAIKGKDAALVVIIPMAIMTMHFTWGTGFLISLAAK